MKPIFYVLTNEQNLEAQIFTPASNSQNRSVQDTMAETGTIK